MSSLHLCLFSLVGTSVIDDFQQDEIFQATCFKIMSETTKWETLSLIINLNLVFPFKRFSYFLGERLILSL